MIISFGPIKCGSIWYIKCGPSWCTAFLSHVHSAWVTPTSSSSSFPSSPPPSLLCRAFSYTWWFSGFLSPFLLSLLVFPFLVLSRDSLFLRLLLLFLRLFLHYFIILLSLLPSPSSNYCFLSTCPSYNLRFFNIICPFFMLIPHCVSSLLMVSL